MGRQRTVYSDPYYPYLNGYLEPSPQTVLPFPSPPHFHASGGLALEHEQDTSEEIQRFLEVTGEPAQRRKGGLADPPVPSIPTAGIM